MPAKVGLTGGIGSGKSTVANIFRGIGVCVVDADKIAHKLTHSGTEEFDQIVEYFGQQILNSNGEINRQMLGQIVFSNDDKRKYLESILHPSIRQEMQNKASNADGPYIVMEIPLLIETGQYQEMDRVLVITCSNDIRIKRLMSNRKMSLDRANNILNVQKTDAQRIVFANDVLSNNDDLDALERGVLKLHHQYCELFES